MGRGRIAKRLLIDANVLISFATDRHLQQQKQAQRVFEEASQLKRIIYCPFYVLTEFVYVLEKVYLVDKGLIRDMVHEFLSMPGIGVLYKLDVKKLLTYWPKIVPDWGDAIVLTSWEEVKKERVAIFTFDRKFVAILKKLKVPVWEPWNIENL